MAIGVIAGGILVGATWVPHGALLAIAALAAMCIGAGGNAVNDIADVRIDRINRPDRPIPGGDISTSQARMVWIGLSLIGLLLALWISPAHGVLAAVCILLLFVYSRWFKQLPLIGNATVALLTALALLFGGLVEWTTLRAIPPALTAGMAFAGITTLAREIVKDVEDLPGDAQTGIRTLPILAGIRPSLRLAIGLLFITLIAIPSATAFGLPPLFLVLSIPAAAALLVCILFLLSVSEDRESSAPNIRRASTWIKLTMVLGLAALAFSGA